MRRYNTDSRGLATIILMVIIIKIASSCTAGVLELDFPFRDDWISVNGLVDTTGVNLSLRRSVNPNDTIYYDQEYPLESARVRVNISGKPDFFVDTMIGGSANYFFPLPVALDDTLQMMVEAAGFSTATAEMITIPDTFEDFTVEITNVNMSEVGDRFRYRISLQLTYSVAPSQQPKAFILSLPNAAVRDINDPGFLSDLEDDINTNCGISRGRWMSWNTRCFANGESTTLPLTIRFNTSRLTNSLTLELASVQEALNEHLVSLNQNTGTFDRLFIENNPTLFNVDGGFGVVSGKFARQVTVGF